MQEIESLRYELYDALDRNDEKAALIISQKLDKVIVKTIRNTMYLDENGNLNDV